MRVQSSATLQELLKLYPSEHGFLFLLCTFWSIRPNFSLAFFVCDFELLLLDRQVHESVELAE